MGTRHDNSIGCDPAIIFDRDTTPSLGSSSRFAVTSDCCQHCVLTHNTTISNSNRFRGMNYHTISKDDKITG
jgi:hypothetical protein